MKTMAKAAPRAPLATKAMKLSCTACWKKVSVKRLKSCGGCGAHLCPSCRRDHPEKVCVNFKLLLEPKEVEPVVAWANA